MKRYVWWDKEGNEKDVIYGFGLSVGLGGIVQITNASGEAMAVISPLPGDSIRQKNIKETK